MTPIQELILFVTDNSERDVYQRDMIRVELLQRKLKILRDEEIENEQKARREAEKLKQEL